MQMEDPLLTQKEAAEYTRVSTENLKTLRFRGQGPRFLKPTPRVVLYRKSVLDKWLEDSERTSTAEAS